MKNNLKAAILAALLLAPAVSFAQEVEVVVEEESNFSANVGFVTDYVFRGISQTSGGTGFFDSSAIQGGLDYSFGDSGFYIGTWGSNVNYGVAGGPDLEVDLYAGWNHDLGEFVNFDAMLIAYTYFGADSLYGDSNYAELITKFGFGDWVTLTLGYTPDYANSGADVTYANLGNSWDLGSSGIALDAAIGRTFGDPFNGDYTDWTVGLSKDFGGVNLGLHYYDTNLNYDASDAIVLSAKFGF
ncbi:MAG: TorF family putative porin [Arenimonas sp.]|nr:TorF family putative porin [Arenimonas sp.]